MKNQNGFSIDNYTKIYLFDKCKLKHVNIVNTKINLVDSLDGALAENIISDSESILVINGSIPRDEVEKFGLREFENYVYEEYIGKKIVIIYGNCHTMVISEYLKNCAEFCDQYAIYPIKPIQTIKDPKYFKLPVFKVCDLFIHQSIQLNNRYGEDYASENIIKILPISCRIIAIPNVYQLPVCFFPQYEKAHELRWRGDTMFFRDKRMDTYLKQGVSLRKIALNYNDCEMYSEEMLDEAFEKFKEKVLSRENEWDIKAWKYINDNFQKKQLFYDPNHPTNEFLRYVVEELLSLLEIEYDAEALEKSKVTKLDSYQMPMLKVVKNHFDMRFEEEELRNTGRKVRHVTMDLQEYVKQYSALIWTDKDFGFWKRGISLIRFVRMKIQDILIKVNISSILSTFLS